MSNEIVERNVSDPLTEAEDGTIAVVREFWVRARTRVEAYRKMKAAGHRRLSPYRDHLGNTPDSRIMQRSMTIVPDGPEGMTASRYIASVLYESRVAGSLAEPELGGPVIWDTQSQQTTEQVDVDRHGNALVNTAGAPFEDPSSIPKTIEILVARWRIRDNFFDTVKRFRKFNSKTNSRRFKGAEPRELLCRSIKTAAIGTAAFGGKGELQCELTLEFAPTIQVKDKQVPGFTEARISVGRFEKNPLFSRTSPAHVPRFLPIMVGDADSGERKQVSTPVILTKDGFENRADTPRPIVMLFENIEEVDLNAIGI